MINSTRKLLGEVDTYQINENTDIIEVLKRYNTLVVRTIGYLRCEIEITEDTLLNVFLENEVIKKYVIQYLTVVKHQETFTSDYKITKKDLFRFLNDILIQMPIITVIPTEQRVLESTKNKMFVYGK